MRKKGIVSALLVGAMVLGITSCSGDGNKQSDEGNSKQNTGAQTAFDSAAEGLEDGEVALLKSAANNPIVGGNLKTEELVYTADPSVLVDGDTVYLYAGHDEATDSEVDRRIYSIGEYLCYSTKDLKEWKEEGSVFKVSTDVNKWVRDSATAWASQVAKHHDEKSGKDKYYLYYCSWDRTSQGKQSIGVAVADSPTGPFEDIGKPLVRGTLTESQNSNWDDIDPTVWIEEDESGEEHRYLGWGNSRFFTCELNEDMISVKDLNDDGKITYGATAKEGDVLPRNVSSFTEAPWFYRRQDQDGKYYGKYYLFHASGWRESMAYSTTDDLLSGEYTYGGNLMPPSATANTNHMAVFDFKGKTYFVYHNGSLPGGNGYRRSACITELVFNDDGSVKEIPETAVGLTGTVSRITLENNDDLLVHANVINSSSDASYPYSKLRVGIKFNKNENNAGWVICDGKADKEKAAYVSIQSEDKPGLFLTANDDGKVTLAQDVDATEDTAKRQTFRTVKGLENAEGVSFESVSQKGKYLSIENDTLCLTDGTNKAASTFYVRSFE